MSPIKQIFFYRAFLCVVWQGGAWQIHCLTAGYSYPGKVGGATAAKNQIDYFLKLRQEKIDRQNS
jgi:hypothetical protein